MSPRDQPRLDALQAKLAERTGKPGYKANCEAIKAEIARLLGDAGASPDSQEFVLPPEPIEMHEN